MSTSIADHREDDLVFNSLTFVVFFANVVALHAMPSDRTTRKVKLPLASYLLYAAWNPPFVVLLWASTVIDWIAAQKLVQAATQGRRRAWMPLSVAADLAVLS